MKLTQKQKLAHLNDKKYNVISFRGDMRVLSYCGLNAIQVTEEIAAKSARGAFCIVIDRSVAYALNEPDHRAPYSEWMRYALSADKDKL